MSKALALKKEQSKRRAHPLGEYERRISLCEGEAILRLGRLVSDTDIGDLCRDLTKAQQMLHTLQEACSRGVMEEQEGVVDYLLEMIDDRLEAMTQFIFDHAFWEGLNGQFASEMQQWVQKGR